MEGQEYLQKNYFLLRLLEYFLLKGGLMKKLFFPLVILIIYSVPSLTVAMEVQSRESSFFDTESGSSSSRSLSVFTQENTKHTIMQSEEAEETFPFAGTAEPREDSSDRSQSLKKWFNPKKLVTGTYWTVGALADMGLTIATEALTIHIIEDDLNDKDSAQPIAIITAGLVGTVGIVLLWVGHRAIRNHCFKSPEPSDNQQ